MQMVSSGWLIPKPGSNLRDDAKPGMQLGFCITGAGYEMVRDVALDHVWTAVRFKKSGTYCLFAYVFLYGGSIAGGHPFWRRSGPKEKSVRLAVPRSRTYEAERLRP